MSVLSSTKPTGSPIRVSKVRIAKSMWRPTTVEGELEWGADDRIRFYQSDSNLTKKIATITFNLTDILKSRRSVSTLKLTLTGVTYYISFVNRGDYVTGNQETLGDAQRAEDAANRNGLLWWTRQLAKNGVKVTNHDLSRTMNNGLVLALILTAALCVYAFAFAER